MSFLLANLHLLVVSRALIHLTHVVAEEPCSCVAIYGSTRTMNVAVYVTGEPYALYEFLVTRAIGIVTATRSPLAESWTLLWLWRPRNLHP